MSRADKISSVFLEADPSTVVKTSKLFRTSSVKLERVLGLTVSSNASLATAPSTGKKPGNTKSFDVERVKLGKDYSVKIEAFFSPSKQVNVYTPAKLCLKDRASK